MKVIESSNVGKLDSYYGVRRGVGSWWGNFIVRRNLGSYFWIWVLNFVDLNRLLEWV